MRQKFKWIVTSMLMLCVGLTYAQEKTVSGNVTDQNELPLPGVSVVIDGTTSGTQTDFDGNYTIDVEEGQTLRFSYVGQTTVERTVGADATMNVQMEDDATQLEEVVLTALGLEKKKDEDLSSSTTVNTDALQRSGESGVIQGIAGKTSGVQITKNAGDPGAGANIQIRGQNTILGSSSPLIIIDGIPISNESIGSNDGSTTGGVVQQSRLNDINPDDIANMTVLKGAAAASVYGTGAANGVIVIQTKRGRGANGKRVSVDIRSTVTVDEINVEYDKQGIYGQGSGGAYVANTGSSWGDKIANRSGGPDDVQVGTERFVTDQGSVIYPLVQKNSRQIYNQANRDQVFGTGLTTDKSVSVGFNTEFGNTLFSYSDWDQKGIINGGSNYRRNTLRLNHDIQLTDKVKFRFNTSYTKVKSDRVQQGSNINGLYLGYLRTSPDYDNTEYKGTYYDADGLAYPNSQRGYRRYLGDGVPTYNNPGWTINEQENPNKVERFIINPELTWNFMDNLSLTARYGLDYYNDVRVTFFPVNSAGEFATGQYLRDELTEKNQTFTAFLQSSNDISENLSLGWILGVQHEERDYNRLSGESNQFTNPFVGDLRLFGNALAENEFPSDRVELERKSGAYAVINAEFFNQLLLEVSGRYERPSTLERNIFYPSVSLGWQFSNIVGESDWFSFGKLRASYGEVGIEPDLYRSRTTFSPGGIASSWGDELLPAVYGNPFTRNTIKGNPDLTEERVKEYEIGTDLRFFNNKLTLGFTYYNRVTEDAILELDLPPSTGFSSVLENAAEISNKGFEVDLGLKLLSQGDFKWDLNINFSKNENIVESLSGVQSVFLNGFTGVSSRVVEGEPFAALWGGKWARDANGGFVLDANGFPTVAAEEGVLGDPNPDWRGGLGTSISYKGFTLSAQVETSQGNDMWGGTSGVLTTFGIDPNTANESVASSNLTNYAGETIASGTTFRGNIGDFGGGPVALDQSWYGDLGGGFGPVGEQFVEDASWTRVRELSLFYALPKSFIDAAGLTNAEIGLTGRNLFLWTDFEGVDPDFNLTGTSKGRGLDYFTNPGTRSYILALKLSF